MFFQGQDAYIGYMRLEQHNTSREIEMIDYKTLNGANLFKALDKASSAMGETNDCAVKALAAATENQYPDAHKALKVFGRRNRKGTYFSHMTKPAVKSLGYQLTEVKGHKGVTINRIPSHLDSSKTYLIQTARHILCVKNGQVVDWTAGRRHRVKSVHIVEATQEPAPKAVVAKPAKPAKFKRASSKRLSDTTVRHIRILLERGMPIKKVAGVVGVSYKTVYNCKTGYSYSDVK